MRLILTAENPAPAGGVVTMVRAADGVTIRVARWHPAGDSLGTVVICTGRAEFIEKYFETVGELLERRLTGWAHRGQS